MNVQSLSRVQLFVTPWTTARQASRSIINSRSLLTLISIELVTPSNHRILCHSLLLLPSIFPSIRVFSNESALHIRWPKYCSFSFNISPSNEHPGLISFRMYCLDLLAVQETLKSLLQQHISKASILRHSAFLLIVLPAILIPACASSSPAFLIMYSAYKLNKQGDDIQPWRTPFPIWNQSVVPCPVLSVASWPAYRFLRKQVRWSDIPISWRIFHSLLWSTQSKALV